LSLLVVPCTKCCHFVGNLLWQASCLLPFVEMCGLIWYRYRYSQLIYFLNQMIF
jgi:hypothetical protein